MHAIGLQPAVPAQKLPRVQVGCRNRRMQQLLALPAVGVGNQERAVALDPLPVCSAPLLHHLPNEGNAIFLRDEVQNRITVRLVVRNEGPKRVLESVPIGRLAGGEDPGALALHEGLEELFLGAEAAYHRLHRHAAFLGDALQCHAVERLGAERGKRRIEDRLAGGPLGLRAGLFPVRAGTGFTFQSIFHISYTNTKNTGGQGRAASAAADAAGNNTLQVGPREPIM